jgi:HEAT repeat protein
MGNTLKSAGKSEYDALRDSLLAYAYSSAEPKRKADYISALGNTGDQAMAGDITSMLDDADPIVRRAAALSLGQLGTADTVHALTDTLTRESNGTVRAAIVDTLTDLPTTDANATLTTIATAIQNEPVEAARFAMAGYLEKHITVNSDYKSLLQQLIRKEPSKRVRQRLGEALAAIELR